MKMNQMTTMVFLISTFSIHAPAQDKALPSHKELDYKLEKSCFHEFKNKGCVLKNGDEDTNCVRKIKNALSKQCRDFIDLRDWFHQ